MSSEYVSKWFENGNSLIKNWHVMYRRYIHGIVFWLYLSKLYRYVWSVLLFGLCWTLTHTLHLHLIFVIFFQTLLVPADLQPLRNMANILGIEFAPLSIPMYRRIQTLCALQWVLLFLFGGFGCLFLSIYLLFTKYYWIVLIYLVWYAYDRNTPELGGNAIKSIRHSRLWKYMRDYYPAELHKTEDLDPTKSYIFGLHPHGIMQASGFLSFATEATGFSQKFPGLVPHLVILAGQFQFPFYREYILTGGKTYSNTWYNTVINSFFHNNVGNHNSMLVPRFQLVDLSENFRTSTIEWFQLFKSLINSRYNLWVVFLVLYVLLWLLCDRYGLRE